MIKKISVVACFFFSLMSNAQSGSASPYSFFGLGESRFKGNIENRSMGGVNVEQDSLHINILNPASFASVRFTTFTMGGNYAATNLKTDSGSENAQRTTLDYLAVSLPLGKMSVGFGLLPYTSVGYHIHSTTTDPDGENNVMKGSGGLNKAFLSLGYTVIPNLVIGADVQYNFGRINNSNLGYISGVPIGTYEENKADLNGFATNFGIMYKHKLYKKVNLYSGFTYAPQSKLSSSNTKTIATVTYNSDFNTAVIDAKDSKEIRHDMTIPDRVSFGFGAGQTKKWMVGTQMTFQNVGDLANDYNMSDKATYGKYSSYSLGGYYVPNFNVFSKYYQKVVYRGGLRYTKTGTIVNSEEIDDKALTLGFGLPIPPSMGSFTSGINIGLEFGQKGTTAKGLVQENYFNFSMSFSLNDRWFGQRKIE
ncbi:hypothetical protein [Flavobacterium gilvum]|uniref:Outer membrane protein n=1 Tax=Flavobacterium gilvum TaxID=1492737 RepID=A0AAC9N4K2_9FLAO|nr:hypothetical protein [Flavobacterium gilvum]AOW08396.1 hypothetical protein EM308_02120 [Flavobacterium gilvum]KFC58318.1 membrane protein [Flavobacterium gilvum]